MTTILTARWTVDLEQNHLYRCQYSPNVYCSHSCHSGKQHTAKCRYRGHCVTGTDATDAERESRDYFQTEEGENGRHFGTVAEEVPQVKRAGSVEKTRPLKKRCRNFFCFVQRFS